MWLPEQFIFGHGTSHCIVKSLRYLPSVRRRLVDGWVARRLWIRFQSRSRHRGRSRRVRGNRKSLWLPQQRCRSPPLHPLHLLVPSLKASIKTARVRITEICFTRSSTMFLWTNFPTNYLPCARLIIEFRTNRPNRGLPTNTAFPKRTSKPLKKLSRPNSSPASCDSPLMFRLRLHT